MGAQSDAYLSGRQTWQRRYFVLKRGCLFYYSMSHKVHDSSLSLLFGDGAI
jgi:hypothetical protein